jgi:hypothetical protein
MTMTWKSDHARRLLLAVAGAALLLLAAAPAVGQETGHQWTVGWGGSWMSYTPFLQADGERLESNIALENGIAATVFADRWLNRWVGIRLDGMYHRGEIRLPEQRPGVDTWAVNGGVTLRPFGDMILPAAPYVFGTGGLISYGLGGESLRVADQVIYDADATKQFVAQVGGGLDLLLLDTWEENTIGVRLEAARMMPWDRPFHFEEESSPGRHEFWRFTIGLTASVLPY